MTSTSEASSSPTSTASNESESSGLLDDREVYITRTEFKSTADTVERQTIGGAPQRAVSRVRHEIEFSLEVDARTMGERAGQTTALQQAIMAYDVFSFDIPMGAGRSRGRARANDIQLSNPDGDAIQILHVVADVLGVPELYFPSDEPSLIPVAYGEVSLASNAINWVGRADTPVKEVQPVAPEGTNILHTKREIDI